MEQKDKIEIPFGAFDSELGGFEYTIPEGLEAEVKDGKVIFRKSESEDEKIINNIKKVIGWYRGMFTEKSLMPEEYQEINAWLEKQGGIQKKIAFAYQEGYDDGLRVNFKMLDAQPKDVAYIHEAKTGNGNIRALVTEKVQLPKKYEKQGEQKQVEVRPFNTVFSQEQIDEIDKRIEKEIKLYNAKLMDAQMRAKDFPMTD